jgi:hypothetical protein
MVTVYDGPWSQREPGHHHVLISIETLALDENPLGELPGE